MLSILVIILIIVVTIAFLDEILAAIVICLVLCWYAFLAACWLVVAYLVLNYLGVI